MNLRQLAQQRSAPQAIPRPQPLTVVPPQLSQSYNDLRPQFHDAHHSAPQNFHQPFVESEEDSDEVTVKSIIETKPSPKVVREFFRHNISAINDDSD